MTFRKTGSDRRSLQKIQIRNSQKESRTKCVESSENLSKMLKFYGKSIKYYFNGNLPAAINIGAQSKKHNFVS